MEQIYPNHFAKIGISDEAVSERIDSCFQTIFFDPAENFFHETAAVATHLQDFFYGIPAEKYMAYQQDGTPAEEPAMHPVAITATLAAASIASDSVHAGDLLRSFWDTPLRKGKRRYYDNCLYFFCLLMLGGRYRIYG